MTTKLRKTDIVLMCAAAVLAVALVFALRLGAFAGGREAQEKTVRISVDGEVLGEYPLAEDRDIPVDTERGHNLVRIRDGEAFMAEADCPDHYCEQQGKIRGGARSVICLPHRLVIEIVGAEPAEEDVDIVAG